MLPLELGALARALGREVLETRTLAGGYSHETSLVRLDDGTTVVARLGGTDPLVEAAVMRAGGGVVPVPRVLLAVAASAATGRAVMALERVAGRLLGDVLADDTLDSAGLQQLGVEVGRAIAAVGRVQLERPGFFSDATLTVAPQAAWSQQLPEFARTCMAATPDDRLDAASRSQWVELCAAHAPSLRRVDGEARLVHADANPKNVLVTSVEGRWRVDAVLDWEFAFSGCPYGDAANMLRFADTYPSTFVDGFVAGFAERRPDDPPLPPDWLHIGHVLDLFAVSDLMTRPTGHVVADQAAGLARHWLAAGVPTGARGRED